MNLLPCLNISSRTGASEFGDPDALETGVNGIQRSSIYYCDPMQSGQKGGLEQAEDGFGAVSVKSGRQVRNLALNGIRPLQRKSVDGTR